MNKFYKLFVFKLIIHQSFFLAAIYLILEKETSKITTKIIHIPNKKLGKNKFQIFQ